MKTETRNIVVASLLGDGWLDRLKPRTQTSIYHLKYNDKSFGYLSWIREQVEELEPSILKAKPGFSQHYFYTRSRQDIGDLRKLFYPNEGIKRVPENISALLTDPISLAVWYQDDGTLDRRPKYHWNVRIATYCFPYDDCVLLRDALKQNFGITVSVCKCQMRGKLYFQLYVHAKSMERFIEIVKPYIHENLKYKIFGLN